MLMILAVPPVSKVGWLCGISWLIYLPCDDLSTLRSMDDDFIHRLPRTFICSLHRYSIEIRMEERALHAHTLLWRILLSRSLWTSAPCHRCRKLGSSFWSRVLNISLLTNCSSSREFRELRERKRGQLCIWNCKLIV